MDSAPSPHPVVDHVQAAFGPDARGGLLGPVADGVDVRLVLGAGRAFAAVYTTGLSDRPITTVFPQEIVCFVRPDQWAAARHLVEVVAAGVLDRGRGLVLGDVIRGPAPVLADTAIVGVLAAGNGYLGDSFDAIRGADGAVVTHLVTIVPVTAAEADLLQSRPDAESALFEAMAAKQLSELDVTRSSAV